MEQVAVFEHKDGNRRVVAGPDFCYDMDDALVEGVEIVYRDTSRYVLGNKAVSDPGEYAREREDTHWVFPVYAYIHGAVALSLAPFSCPWDSGQSGYILFPNDWAKDYEAARKCAEAILDTATAAINGEVYVLVSEKQCECCGCWERDENEPVLGGVVGWDGVKSAIKECFGEGFEEAA